MEDRRRAHEYSRKSGSASGNSIEDAQAILKIARRAMIEGDIKRAKRLALKGERMYRTREGEALLNLLSKKDGTETAERIAVKKEHTDEIQRVKGAKDVYDILGVQKYCSPEEVSKAFRRLSLVLHPDKNKAEGAEDAYMTVTEAVKILKSTKPKKS